MSAARWLLLSRPQCGLCDDFLEELAHVMPALASRIEIADVDANAEWRATYGLRIPVLLDVAGRVLCEGRFNAQRLREQTMEIDGASAG